MNSTASLGSNDNKNLAVYAQESGGAFPIMADNVDLMVIGVSDGQSADELTHKLVAEFRQPASAFKALVAAACLGEPPYAAQSAVSLDTAVEGQMQLESLGVLCQLLMDGKEMGGASSQSPAASHDESVAEPAKESSVDEPANQIAAPPVEPEELPAQPDTPAEASIADAEQFDGIDEDIEALGSAAALAEISAARESADAKLEEGAADGARINFQDELGSLDDELQRVSEARQTKPAKVPESEVEKPDSQSNEPADDSTESLEVVDSPDDVEEIDSDSAVADAKPEVTALSGDSLELSLSVDDSQPLTKPKSKSDSVADDGGLTLSLDDDTPLTAPKKPSGNTKPTDGGLSLSLDDDAPLSEAPAAVEKTNVPSAVQPETSAEAESVENSDSTEADASVDAVEARDTSRELKEEIKPPLDEAEPNETDKDSTPAAKPEIEPESVAAPPENSDEKLAAREPAATPEALKTSSTSSIDSLIEDLTSNAGGLVLPGQVPVEEPVETVAEEPIETPADVVVANVDLDSNVSSEAAAELHGVDLDAGVDSRAADADHLEALVERELKAKRVKTATVATAAVALLGGGAAFYFLGGMPASKALAPVAAVTQVVNENSALEAAEEVSLNAAIERSTEISNPDNYSTEELIAYLSKDLGADAQKELQDYVNGSNEPELAAAKAAVPRMGPAIPADSKSVLWLKNRVAHPADKYFDEWVEREVALQAYMELQERLIDVGDLDIARGISGTTEDRLFTVMSLQRLARSYHELGHSDKALEVLESALRSTYGIESEAERVIAIADYAYTEKELGLEEDSLDTFLKASILARSLRKPESKTVALSSIAEYYDLVNRVEDTKDYLDMAMKTAFELPVNTAARDLAIRHVALTEVKLGLTAQATEHANLIVDPFAAVSALHGIALELERTGDQTNARLTLNMAYRAGSLIKNSEKREKLLEKIKLAGG